MNDTTRDDTNKNNTPQTPVNKPIYNIGDRVQLHPATDAWMRGDRYGAVQYVGKRGAPWYRLSMDSGRMLRVAERNILERVEA